jgi:hypothetical protein
MSERMFVQSSDHVNASRFGDLTIRRFGSTTLQLQRLSA